MVVASDGMNPVPYERVEHVSESLYKQFVVCRLDQYKDFYTLTPSVTLVADGIVAVFTA